jgi:hypothetical protein
MRKGPAIMAGAIVLGWLPAIAHGGWLNDNLLDPEDGQMDLSAYLASAKGFLPVPIIITEPAVGFGLGAAVAYFHAPKELDAEQHPHQGPPSITVGFGAKTDNGTYLYGAAHSGVWKDDHVRYVGAVAKINVNTKFYPFSGTEQVPDDGIKFNIDGNFLYQDMQLRLKESNWWVGANYIYVNADNTFLVFDDIDIELPNPQFEFTQGGLGLSIEYDGRNTTFTPTQGTQGEFQYVNYDENWGGDFDFDQYTLSLFHYRPVGKYSSLGMRLKADAVNGDVPFFAYPFVDLRGIPAMRYQGEQAYTAELEYLWGFTPRWTLVFFGGVGKTTTVDEFLAEDENVAAGGLGLRYRLARVQGLQAGIDIARGPEETSFYITVGSAW